MCPQTRDRASCVGESGEATADEWNGLRVGDRVRVTGPPSFQRGDLFELIELHTTEETLGVGALEVMAVVRDPEGHLHTVVGSRLERQ
jgi:hypothetical protein